MNRFCHAKWLLFVLLFTTSCTAYSQTPEKMELLGQAVIPYNQSFQDTPIGGLSGLTYDPASNMFYVISDDRSELAGARYYSFRVKMDSITHFGTEAIEFEEVHFLKTSEGTQYGKGSVDPEGIAIGPDGTMYISSEGVPEKQIPPFVNAFRKDGAFDYKLNIPNAYWSSAAGDSKARGVRSNFGFEGLAISPGATRLYAGTENALLQDGPAADSSNSSPARIIVYELPSGKILHEYCYNVPPVHIEDGIRDLTTSIGKNQFFS